MGVTRKEILNILLDAYKSTNNISAETMLVYSATLADIPIPALKSGVVKCIESCKFFPSVAEIRQASKDFYEEVSGTRRKSYDEAWLEVMQNLKSVGYYGTPHWSSTEIEQAVKTMGWTELCSIEEEALQAVRAQFRGIYNAICERNSNSAKNQALYQSLSPEQKAQLHPAEEFVKKLAMQKDLRTIAGGKK